MLPIISFQFPLEISMLSLLNTKNIRRYKTILQSNKNKKYNFLATFTLPSTFSSKRVQQQGYLPHNSAERVIQKMIFLQHSVTFLFYTFFLIDNYVILELGFYYVMIFSSAKQIHVTLQPIS